MKYQTIKNAVSYELANFIFNYFMLKRDAVEWMYKNNITYDNGMFGTWTDKQIPNTYSHYADHVMETLLMKVLPVMKRETDLELIPTYSYARIYKKGDVLHRHKDRPSCEISTTINLEVIPGPCLLILRELIILCQAMKLRPSLNPMLLKVLKSSLVLAICWFIAAVSSNTGENLLKETFAFRRFCIIIMPTAGLPRRISSTDGQC